MGRGERGGGDGDGEVEEEGVSRTLSECCNCQLYLSDTSSNNYENMMRKWHRNGRRKRERGGGDCAMGIELSMRTSKRAGRVENEAHPDKSQTP